MIRAITAAAASVLVPLYIVHSTGNDGSDGNRSARDGSDVNRNDETQSVRVSPPRIVISPQRQSKGEQVAVALLAGNVAIYAAWQAPSDAIQRAMRRYFTSGGEVVRGRFARLASPLLACYSHSSLFHLAANMIGLMSFVPKIVDGNGRSSGARSSGAAPPPHLSPVSFLTMYNVAGVGASLASTAFSSRLGTGRPGLGASGALFAVIGYYAQAFPDARVLLFFFMEMSAREALILATVMNGGLAAKEVLAARGRSE